MVTEPGEKVAENATLLDRRDASPQADGMAEAKEVQTRHIEGHAGAEAGGSSRHVEAGRAAANTGEFGAQTSIEHISLGFVHVIDDVLVLLLAVRILNRHIHLGKDPEIVETPLRVGHAEGRKRVAGSQQ